MGTWRAYCGAAEATQTTGLQGVRRRTPNHRHGRKRTTRGMSAQWLWLDQLKVGSYPRSCRRSAAPPSTSTCCAAAAPRCAPVAGPSCPNCLVPTRSRLPHHPDARRLAGAQLHEAIVGCAMITTSQLTALMRDAGCHYVRVDQPRSSRIVSVGRRLRPPQPDHQPIRWAGPDEQARLSGRSGCAGWR